MRYLCNWDIGTRPWRVNKQSKNTMNGLSADICIEKNDLCVMHTDHISKIYGSNICKLHIQYVNLTY